MNMHEVLLRGFRQICIVLFLGLSLSSTGQIGGNNIYEFLNLSQSPRVTALGGNLITVLDGDVSLAYGNPATLNRLMHQKLTFNSEIYFGGTGIVHGYAGYGIDSERLNMTFHGGIQYVSYGEFDGRDIYGEPTTPFRAGETALVAGANRALTEKIQVGANVKLISSLLGGYNSFGMATDIAGMYRDTARRMTATLVIKNVGLQFNKYADQREPIPFEIQAGFSKKLKYLPLRISVIGVQLQRWNITYDDPNQEDETLLFGEESQGDSKALLFVDNLFRHIIVNGEFLFGKKENFTLRIGYNHLRRAELSLENLRSLAGFSGGVGFKIKQFRIDYGVGIYHIGGTVHHFGVSTDIGEFR